MDTSNSPLTAGWSLNIGLNCKLTLISASAGFGKTSLLSQWVQQCHSPVAVSTIKWHLKHIYSRLDAHNRAQAIKSARELQLLPE